MKTTLGVTLHISPEYQRHIQSLTVHQRSVLLDVNRDRPENQRFHLKDCISRVVISKNPDERTLDQLLQHA